MLKPGIAMEHEFTVEGQLMTDVGGTLGFSVLSTPGMIGTGPTRPCRVGGERTAAMLVLPLLEEGQATVGFEVCIKHVAGAGEGQQCVARAELTEVIDSRKLRFDVEVTEGDRVIGVGTHERRVIARG
jgi:predicted thioesterase